MITTAYLETKFEYYNQAFFGGILPMPYFGFKHTKNYLGICQTYVHKPKERATIYISNYYVLPKQDLLSILVHEMIHYYIHYTEQRDNKSHGYIFVRIMNKINKQTQYGLNININSDVSRYAPSKASLCEFIAFKCSNNTHFLMRISKGSYDYFRLSFLFLKGKGHVSEFVYFKDTNKTQYINLISCRKNIRGVNISEDDYNTYKQMSEK